MPRLGIFKGGCGEAVVQGVSNCGVGVLEGRYADSEQLTLVVDNLSTHGIGTSYQAFAPARASDLVRRNASRRMPKHPAWPAIAENEFCAMTGQGMCGRLIGDLETLQPEI